ncbi:MAG: hypothetical protein QOK01_3158, partial [Alphaproteobacteria bacterium]|nr:hypothetical protein [Alphaproteobacteria bacterium]
MKPLIRCLAVGAALALAAGDASMAQDFSAKPIRIIVGLVA